MLRRWSKKGRGTELRSSEATLQPDASFVDKAGMRSLAYASCMELVGMCTQTRQSFEVGIEFMTRAKEAINAMTVVEDSGVGAEGDHSEGNIVPQVSAQAPHRVRSRGRPKEGRFKSPIEGVSRKRKAKNSSERGRADGGGTNASAGAGTRKCRLCGSGMHYASKCPRNTVPSPKKKQRHCHTCGSIGHYSTTCGRRSTYNPTE